jgi:hypothetical protein
MAISTKTICYAFPAAASAANNTLTPPLTLISPLEAENSAPPGSARAHSSRMF